MGQNGVTIRVKTFLGTNAHTTGLSQKNEKYGHLKVLNADTDSALYSWTLFFICCKNVKFH